MSDSVFLAYKTRSIAHLKAVKLLDKHCEKNKAGIIPFCEVRRVFAFFMHFKRKEAWVFMKELKAVDLIEIIPYHGIKIKNSEARR